jgi:NAD(P)-dependent dehydrogenase (short-subunit alcohol dehydrogenase family)
MNEDKRVVIVGGNSGIGVAIRRLLEDEYAVTCMSRSQETSVDVTIEEPQFPPLEGPLAGLIYCPGSINLRPIKTLTPGAFRTDLEINLIGAVKTIREYLPNLREADSSSIVLFSTVAVGTGMPYHSSVAASKGAVEGLARSLAAELAPRVRVNVVAPSLTETPMSEALLRTDKQRDSLTQRHPLKRLGRPEDIAAAAAFLISSKSSWITGQVLCPDGGMSSLRLQ